MCLCCFQRLFGGMLSLVWGIMFLCKYVHVDVCMVHNRCVCLCMAHVWCVCISINMCIWFGNVICLQEKQPRTHNTHTNTSTSTKTNANTNKQHTQSEKHRWLKSFSGRCSHGFEKMGASGTTPHVHLPRSIIIFTYWNGQKKVVVNGMQMYAIMPHWMEIYKCCSGLAQMGKKIFYMHVLIEMCCIVSMNLRTICIHTRLTMEKIIIKK